MTQQLQQKIDQIEGIVHVRRRPGMYIGGTDERALHHLAYIVIDDVLNEVAAQTCNAMTITICKNGALQIVDNGAGLPVEIDAEHGISGVEVIATHVGMRRTQQQELTSIIDSLGISTINALSEWMEVQTKRDGYLWRQTFSRGEATSQLEKIRPLEADESTGTRIMFLPDGDIFPKRSLDFDTLARRCDDVAHVLQGLQVTLRDERGEFREENFFASDGLACWARERTRIALHPIVHLAEQVEHVKLEIAFQFMESGEIIEKSYANTVPTPDHGEYVYGMRAGILEFVNRDAKSLYDLRMKWEDIAEGFTGVVSLFHPDPQYFGRFKVEIMNPEVFGISKNLTLHALQT